MTLSAPILREFLADATTSPGIRFADWLTSRALGTCLVGTTVALAGCGDSGGSALYAAPMPMGGSAGVAGAEALGGAGGSAGTESGGTAPGGTGAISTLYGIPMGGTGS